MYSSTSPGLVAETIDFGIESLMVGTESVTTILNPTKKINDLKKQLQFANTHENQVLLADAYFQNNDFINAISHYEKSLNGLFKKDEYTHRQLVKSFIL